MSELPVGWTQAHLAQLAVKVGSGATPRGGANVYKATGTPLIRSMNVIFFGFKKDGLAFLDDQQAADLAGASVVGGDVLLNITGASIGRVTVAPPEMTGARVNQHVCIVRPSGAINAQLLSAYLSTAEVQSQIAGDQYGMTRQALTKQQVLAMEIPVPPVPEQTRIADKLDKLLARIDACRDRLDRLPSLIDRLRQSALTSAIQGNLTADWRTADGGALTVSDAESDEPVVRLVPGWTYERADAACSKVQSGGTPKEGFIAAGGAPFLKVYNLVGQQVDFAYRPQFIANEIHHGSMRKSITLPGDVLMNIVGPPLGKVAVVPADFPQWNINQAITLFRAGPKVLSDWLYFVLCEGSAVRQVMPDTRGSVGQVNISLSQCRAFVFPVPSIDEQREAIRRLQKLLGFAQQLSDCLRKAEAAMNRLTPALLAKAFRGELVPQDPADEPAELMLQRLHTVDAPEVSARRRRHPTTA